MSKIKNKAIEEVVVPNKVAVFEDHKTGVKTVAFPFMFPDGKNGVVSVTRLSKHPWTPSDDIETVVLVWNKDKQFTQ
jgi:hypothetical protein